MVLVGGFGVDDEGVVVVEDDVFREGHPLENS